MKGEKLLTFMLSPVCRDKKEKLAERYRTDFQMFDYHVDDEF
jgi:hypothetical protein